MTEELDGADALKATIAWAWDSMPEDARKAKYAEMTADEIQAVTGSRPGPVSSLQVRGGCVR